jgi:hypothetical protein
MNKSQKLSQVEAKSAPRPKSFAWHSTALEEQKVN